MKYILPLMLLLGLTACAEDDSLSLSPNFNSINKDLFAKSCLGAGCHEGETPARGLNLESGQSYANLVGIQSKGTPDIALVLGGSADNSYLIRKLEGAESIVGNRMPPPDRAAISQSNIDAIRQWIDDGAEQ